MDLVLLHICSEKAVALALIVILALLMSLISMAVCSVVHLWSHLALKPFHLQPRVWRPGFGQIVCFINKQVPHVAPVARFSRLAMLEKYAVRGNSWEMDTAAFRLTEHHKLVYICMF